MTKTIVVSDKVFDWLTRRARLNTSVAQVLQELITATERYEADLAKYRAWVDGGTRIEPLNPPATLLGGD